MRHPLVINKWIGFSLITETNKGGLKRFFACPDFIMFWLCFDGNLPGCDVRLDMCSWWSTDCCLTLSLQTRMNLQLCFINNSESEEEEEEEEKKKGDVRKKESSSWVTTSCTTQQKSAVPNYLELICSCKMWCRAEEVAALSHRLIS